jgi:predicted permease
LIDELRQDLDYALRMLWHSPSFTLIVVATLALGIGANTAVFSVVNAVLLRPLQAPNPQGLVRFITMFGSLSSATTGAQAFDSWRQQTSVFEDVSAHRLEFANLTGEAQPEQVVIARVTADFFKLFRASILHGRIFTNEEDRPNGGAVAILSYGIWTRRFGADPRIIGRTIALGSTPHIVIGIVGRGFETEQFVPQPDIWLPFQIDPQRVDGGNLFLVTGRLKPGIPLEQANAQLSIALAAYRERSPNTANTSWIVQPLQQAMVSRVRPSLTLLLVAVGLVLLIACANVANLLLVRGDGRKREVAIRTAIGAGRGRIVRQLLTETLVLWIAGSLLGLFVGLLTARSLVVMYPGINPFNLLEAGTTIPRIGENASAVSLDWRVLGFTMVTSAIAAIVFGLLPALQAAGADPQAVLKETGGAQATARRSNRGRMAIVTCEIALALMLLVAASLLIRTSLALSTVRSGFDAHNVLTMRMSITGTRFERRDGIAELTRDAAERIRTLNGVLSASMTCCMPLETVWQLPFVVQGRPLSAKWHAFGGWTFVSPRYFEVFKIPIIRGRDFRDSDNASAPGVVIINETMARRFWPDSDPLQDRLIIGRGMRPEYDNDPVRQIIGIAGDVRDTGLERDARPAMYVPVAQVPDGVTTLNVKLLPIVWIVRTQQQPYSVNERVQSELREASGGLPVARVRTMEEVVAESTARQRFNAWLMGIFAVCAVLLAMVGVYGLMAYSVEQRVHEFGIRLALGAASGKIERMVIFRGMLLAFAGTAIGLVAAFNLSRLIAGFLFGVTVRDPLVFVTAAVLVCAVALFAIWIPARRATRADPMALLRHE